MTTQNTIIRLQNVTFGYSDKALVFDKHDLQLEQSSNQSNKLFGIIGPSGTGKTTLLSILGGQLNPGLDKVFVNGVDLYKVDDNQRRNLIGLQMQTATSLKGSLRYNLLFGIEGAMENTLEFSDEFLISILRRVGLWTIFQSKDGLQTMIGEGGLNLSGGQRQRLSFAGLYLRVRHYRPKLVLIDEPTSSLDEVSERSITDMINEIAEQAVTFVVAHRLVTVDQAQALLDTSLLPTNKQMRFYPTHRLLNDSAYYRDLLEGKVKLDE